MYSPYFPQIFPQFLNGSPTWHQQLHRIVQPLRAGGPSHLDRKRYLRIEKRIVTDSLVKDHLSIFIHIYPYLLHSILFHSIAFYSIQSRTDPMNWRKSNIESNQIIKLRVKQKLLRLVMDSWRSLTMNFSFWLFWDTQGSLSSPGGIAGDGRYVMGDFPMVSRHVPPLHYQRMDQGKHVMDISGWSGWSGCGCSGGPPILFTLW